MRGTTLAQRREESGGLAEVIGRTLSRGLATTFTRKLGRVHRAPPRRLVAEATDRVTGSPASPHPPPVLFQTVRAERVPFEARRDPINQDSNQQRKAVSLPCQVSGGSLNEDSGQHLAQKRGSGLDKCPAPTREACGVTPPHFLCGELHGGPLCTCVWGGVGEGVRQNKSLGPASGHENAPERTRT